MKEFIQIHYLLVSYLVISYITFPLIVWFIYKQLKKEPTVAMMLPIIKSTWVSYRQKSGFLTIVPASIFALAILPIAWPLFAISAVRYLLPKAPPKPEPEKVYEPTTELEFDTDSL